MPTTSVLQVLEHPQPVTVRITIDQEALESDGLTYITLAHEIGAHLKPKLKFIRKVVETGGVTEEDLATILIIIAKEHTNIFQTRMEEPPQNPAYMNIVKRFADVIGQTDPETKQQLLDVYLADTQRYSEPDDQIVLAIGQRRLTRALFKKVLRLAPALLVVFAAILMAYYFSTRRAST